jgi:hypothetical protein
LFEEQARRFANMSRLRTRHPILRELFLAGPSPRSDFVGVSGMAGSATTREAPMKGVLAVLVFMLGIFVTPVSAQQSGTLQFNGNVFDAPAAQGAGYAQAPSSYTQPAQPGTSRHVKRHHTTRYKHS